MRQLHRVPRAVALCAALLAALFLTPQIGAQDTTIVVDRELVDNSVKAEDPFDASAGSFTVAVRAKILEQGSEPGNGDGLGMIWNVSNGWDSGMRVVFQWRNSQIAFQLGKPGGGISLGSSRGYFPGVMRDVVATFDGETREARLYVDGELAQTAKFDGELETRNEPLNIGFGGSGVGSNRMYVDKAETWTRALSAQEIAAREAARPEEERAAIAALRDVETASDSSMSVDQSPQKLRDALALDIPESAKVRLRDQLLATLMVREYDVDRSLNTELYDEFAALVFNAAKAALETAEEPDADSASLTSDQLETYGRLKNALERLREISSSCAAKTRSLMVSTSFNSDVNRTFANKANATLSRFGINASRAGDTLKELAQRYPREEAVFATVRKLEVSEERVRRLERDALGIYYGLTAIPRVQRNTRQIKVATTGDDETGNGSLRAPYATLARAFKDVETTNAEAIKAGKTPMKTIIDVAAGEYFTTAPATLENVSNVVVRGASKENTRITGARRIANFASLEDAATTNSHAAEASERFQDEARDKIFVADLKAAGVENIGSLKNRGYGGGAKVNPVPTLTLNGAAQTIARWPNVGQETLPFGEKVEGGPEGVSTFRYDFDRVDNWLLDGQTDDIWAFGLYEWEWAADLRRVVNIDRDAKTIAFDYKDGSGKFDYYFVNVLEELDSPGEYYVDSESGTLYFYPPKSFDSAEALNAATVEYDEYEGRFIELSDVSDVVISDLAMSGGRETAVAMKDCVRCYLSECVIEQMGGNGVVISDGEFCGVVNSRLRSLGAGGVRMTGGDSDTLKPCRHLVHNCYVSDFSRIDRVYAPAVTAYGCGFAITNNLFCDSPHHAMRTDGQDIYVARNEIHSVVYEYSDQSGIDIYCDPSFRGILIERNLWRHIGSAFSLCGQAGVRLDDSISGVVMRENVFYRSSGGIFGGIQIHGGKDNLVINNAFVDCKYAVSFSVWGGDRYEKFVKERFSKHVGSPLYESVYPFFDEIFSHYDRNYIFDNQAINCSAFNRDGDAVNVFVGNTRRSATPDLKKLGVRPDELAKTPEEVFYTNSKALKKWLSDESGISLKDVGLKANWGDAGEDVSPHFVDGSQQSATGAR
ncbi:MAG: right-handed parallel beta-helix repeat-containing protein [Thermoguttaceae bacterium]|jgi:hypothetical protein